jgi:lipoprotein-anchoring transpeptidase ErfK/SrfK
MRSRAGIVALVVPAVVVLAAQSLPVAHAQDVGQGTPGAPPAASPAPKPAPFAVAAPSRGRGATVARLVAPTVARRRLASAKGRSRVSTQTLWSGQPQTLLVLDGATRGGRDWVKVLLPTRPNGSAGWVPRDRVVLGRSRYWIEIRTAARQVTVFRGGRRVRRMRAVVGTSGTPTPHGLAAIYEINRQPNPAAFLGPWVLSLTAHSNVLQSFGGGPGRVGIHGRSGASLADPLGSARSHGCIRIDNVQVSWLADHVPRGTPVRLRH